MHANAALTQRPDNSLNIFISEGAMTRELHIAGVDKMMAFDCGDLELK
jgi:hypothetical protein